jgi:uncharacterized membrane protein YkvA (DUF1232 family)
MRTWLRVRTYLSLLRAIPYLPRAVWLCWRLLRDRRVPLYLKSMVIGALLYALSPLDLMPDILLPVIGYVDDITLLVLAGYYFIRWSPPEVVAEHLAAMDPLQRRATR